MFKKKEMRKVFSEACIKNGGRMTGAGDMEHGCLHYTCEGAENKYVLEVCPKKDRRG